ncbi:MAG TPA: response regulator transcription factor [Chloroflexaceae bacterium]|nr:response regulator transcription factor [Chloroflexaceae bacterium]
MSAGAPRIRVLVVDDHAVVRSGLATFLLACDDMELVGEAAGGAEALALCARARPDVVLMDLVMPDMDGATATRELRAAHPHVQVIALTSYKEQELVQAALQAGAIAYLLKDISADALADAIRAAHAGRPTLAPEAARLLVEATQAPGGPAGPELSEREREVLALMVRGLSNGAIAERLAISRSTVKFHVSGILGKLGAAGRTEAAAIAVQQGLVN